MRGADGRRRCTREAGHAGPHVAHGLLGRVAEVWDGAREVPAVTKRDRRAARPTRSRDEPTGLRVDRPPGPLDTLWKRVARLISSPEELAFLVFFLAFVGFAAYWFFLILG